MSLRQWNVFECLGSICAFCVLGSRLGRLREAASLRHRHRCRPGTRKNWNACQSVYLQFCLFYNINWRDPALDDVGATASFLAGAPIAHIDSWNLEVFCCRGLSPPNTPFQHPSSKRVRQEKPVIHYFWRLYSTVGDCMLVCGHVLKLF